MYSGSQSSGSSPRRPPKTPNASDAKPPATAAVPVSASRNMLFWLPARRQAERDRRAGVGPALAPDTRRQARGLPVAGQQRALAQQRVAEREHLVEHDARQVARQRRGPLVLDDHQQAVAELQAAVRGGQTRARGGRVEAHVARAG